MIVERLLREFYRLCLLPVPLAGSGLSIQELRWVFVGTSCI